jgi:hypothetical protein
MSGNNQLVCGIAASTGPYLALCEPLTLSGNVWYVNFATGVDSATGGLERKAPLKTLAQALTNAVPGDTAVLLETHVEVIAAPITVGEAVTIMGEGKNAGNPMASLQLNHAGAVGAMLVVTVPGVRILNILIKEPAQAAVIPNISVRATDVRIEECRMEMGANNNKEGIGGDGTVCDRLQVDNTTFVSVAPLVSDRPHPAVKFTAAPPNQMKMRGTVFDGGTVGFEDPTTNTPVAMVMTGAQTRIELEAISLLNGADVKLDAATTGYANIQTCTGGSRMVW